MWNFLPIPRTSTLPRPLRWVRGVCIALLALASVSPAIAERGKLRERLTPEVMAVVVPGGTDRLGPEEGSPPAIAAYRDDKIVAYVFSSLDIIAAHGYSTTPFDVIGGVDLDGRITGSKVVFHKEPHIFDDAIRARLLDTFLARQAGRAVRGDTNSLPPDFVAGATVSAHAMAAAVLTTARLVLRPRVARPAASTASAPALDDSFKLISWEELVAQNAIVHRRITSGDVAAALAQAGATDAKPEIPLSSRPDDPYIDIATALFT